MMKLGNWPLITVIGIAFMAIGVLPSNVPAETIIKIGGNGSALGTMMLLAKEYEKSHPGTRIRVLPSLGTTGGVKALLEGGIDLALACRPLTDTERQKGAMAMEYASSPFVFITNLKVKKKDITLREVEAIYKKPVAYWPDGSRIRLILRPEKDFDTILLRSLSPGMEEGIKAAHARPGMIMEITDQEATDAVARTTGALGCATLCEIISENKPVNVLSLNGVKPSVKSITDKTYPLYKVFTLVSTSKTPAKARQFAEFVRSPEAGRILTKNGNMVAKVK